MDVLAAAALVLPTSLLASSPWLQRQRWRLAFPWLLLALAVALRLTQGLTTWNLLLAFWSTNLAGWQALPYLRGPIMKLMAARSPWPSPVTSLRDQWTVNGFRLLTMAAVLGPVFLVYGVWGGNFDLVRLGWGDWLGGQKLFALEDGRAYLAFVSVMTAAAIPLGLRVSGPWALRAFVYAFVAAVLAWGWWGKGNWLVYFAMFQFLGLLPVVLFAAPWTSNRFNRRFWTVAPSALGFALPNGFFEEVVFRGFLFGLLEPVVGLSWAVVLSSLSFGVAHWYGGAPSGFAGSLLTSLGGFIFALSLHGTGGLWWAILAHGETDIAVALAQMDTREPAEQAAVPWPARPDPETFRPKGVTPARSLSRSGDSIDP